MLLYEHEDGAASGADRHRAAARGVSVAHLVRTAIDVVYPPDSDRRRAAAAAILDAEPMDVPDVAELRDELDALRGRR